MSGSSLESAAMSAAAQAHRGREGSALDGFVNEGITEDAGVIDQAGASRRPGRYEAISAIKAIQKTEARAGQAKGNAPTFVGQSQHQGGVSGRSSRASSIAGPHPTQWMENGAQGVGKRQGTLWDEGEAMEIRDFQQQQHQELSIDSSIEDIRNYGQAIIHPGKVLHVLPDEYDREVHTEFDELCNELLSVLGEFETSLEEMTMWKDDFLRQTVPSNIKLQLTLLFARLFRSKSDLHEPLFELIKQVRVHSRPWLNKRFALVELEKDYRRQCHIIDVAIRKMEQMQMQVANIRSEKRVALWERVARRLMDMFPDYATQFVDIEPTPEESSPEVEPKLDTNESMFSIPLTEDRSRPSTSNVDSRVISQQQSQMALKDEIREYIGQDQPSWRRKAKSLVQQFQRLLERRHPGLHNILGQLHRRLVPKPIQPLYTSVMTGSIGITTRRLPGIRKSWSLIDLKAVHEGGDISKSELGGALKRSNSHNALNQAGANVYPLQPLAPESRPAGHRLSSEAEERGTPHMDSEGADLSIAGEYHTSELHSVNDIKYMFENDEAEMQEAVRRFMEGHPLKRAENTEATKNDFTLQDVMELTLLHAQQMQLLHSEYEDRLRRLEQQMLDREAAHSERCADYEKRTEALQERAKRIAQEYQKQAKEVRPTDSKPRTGDAAKDAALLSDIEPSEENLERIHTSGSQPKHSREGRTRTRPSSRLEKEQRSPLRTPVHMLQRKTPPKSPPKPVFNSTAFGMSFMDRLRWFTEMKLQKRNKIQEKFRKIEIDANEERLAQYNLLTTGARGDSPDGVGPRRADQLPAEFMPMPGDIPPVKKRDLWSQQGINPWGGRFSVQRGPAEGMNILNLFDVAMRINRPQLGTYNGILRNGGVHDAGSTV